MPRSDTLPGLIQEVLAHASFLRPLSGHYFDRSPILDAVRLHLPIAPEGGHGTAVFGAIHVAMDPRATAKTAKPPSEW